MTAPAHPDRQGTREELAAAIYEADGDDPNSAPWPWEHATESDQAHYRHLADALLPVVERLCDQRAAEALESAAAPERIELV